MDGWTDGRTDGRTDGKTEGRKDGRTEGRKDGRTDGRTHMLGYFCRKKVNKKYTLLNCFVEKIIRGEN